VTDNVAVATGAAVAVGLAQVVVMRLTGRPIDVMQWLALGLVLVLGAATLITQDSRFIMVKPTVIHWAIGGVMLRHGWMTRYLPPIARDNLPLSVMVTAGYAWSALMFLLGALNFFIATTMSFQVWAWFITSARSAPRSSPSSRNTGSSGRSFAASCGPICAHLSRR
jgi:intracellular septation protein A